jgi:hypothetical protein
MVISWKPINRVIKQLSVFSAGLCCVLSTTEYASAQDLTNKLTLNPAVARVVKDIAKYNVVESKAIGESGSLSMQWERFEKLNRIASDLELRVLTSNTNAVVRCYSFHALALRKDAALFSILVKHLRDTAQVSTLDYDLGGSEMVGDYFIKVLTPHYIDLHAYKLDAEQREKLDSILLYDKNVNLGAQNKLLTALRPDSKHYERVREIALTENNPFAIVALARYKNPNDVKIISDYLEKPKMLYYAMYAVREFPNAEFYPALSQLFENEWNKKSYYDSLWRMLYQALAQYPTPQTVALFERMFTIEDNFRRQSLGENLLVALTKYPNPLFQNVKDKIKLDEYYREEFEQDMNSDIEK